MDLMRGQFVAAQDEAHLRPVAVGDDGLPAALDHGRNVAGRLAYGVPLVLHIGWRAVGDQRVAADGDDSQRPDCHWRKTWLRSCGGRSLQARLLSSAGSTA